MDETICWTLVSADQVGKVEGESFLSDSELLTLSGLRFPKRREEWLLGRWVSKKLLQTLPPLKDYSLGEIEIKNNLQGAPFIVHPDGGIFNGCLSISHSGNQAFCGITLTPNVHLGVDLEQIEPRSTAFIVDYLTTSELEMVEKCLPFAREIAVNLIWSMKESMLKALGVGLHWDTRKVEVKNIEDPISPGTGAGSWMKIQVADKGNIFRSWTGWWQIRQNSILTAAAFTQPQLAHGSISLVEKYL
jgi:4'-phosphopantetheinyl transferase